MLSRHLQQIHSSKLLCGMYGFHSQIGCSKIEHLSNIDEIMRAFHFNSLRWKKAFSSGLIKQTSSSTIASLPCYFHLFNKHGGWNKRGGWAEFFFFHYVKKCTEGKGKLFVYYYIKKLEEEAKSEKTISKNPRLLESQE